MVNKYPAVIKPLNGFIEMKQEDCEVCTIPELQHKLYIHAVYTKLMEPFEPIKIRLPE